ncbi:hypothetical protein EMIHUDRAFT_99051 [Emiliania huxleyi CCMP1516]|uniref:Uncharacterized protein n=2 Tax=Emiliania huxleyi TaxID=2903 RepID=A0A0D3K8G6_EMIH1|nr:hypothetical protein EMIHUDRAFT_99051 [Emiliania huxleyi CCMP1516]EOD32051.1 hypothetical protein EMIHUDRAFT_99051 [Emiliania huxleyi CCMP1516]|eukprot:XP_005784480.1 hypothetical protein EMIHUDRAFT_99051 [Emiliania huxleyi CCMP1516]
MSSAPPPKTPEKAAPAQPRKKRPADAGAGGAERQLMKPKLSFAEAFKAVQPSPTVDDFSAFIDMQRLASQLEPGAPEGGGAALDVSQLDWLKAQSDPLLLRGAAVPLNKPLPDISASVGLGGHTLRATVVRTSSRGKTSIQLRFEDGPVPAKKKATLPQLLGMVGEIGPKLASAQRQSLWADHDPFASADAQAAFLSAILEKRFDDGTARQQAAADTQRADGKTHKAGVYVATLNAALATRHGLPRHYVGLFCRKALMLGRNGWVELPIEVLFSQRRDEHLQAAERTLQEISFQVALHRFGADSFDWRIVLKDGDVPAIVEAAGGPYPETWNLTRGGEGSGAACDSSGTLLASAAGFSWLLVLWSCCMDKPELHREDAVFAGVKVGSLWHNVRSMGIFVKGYPDRILALTERGFVWDVHEAGSWNGVPAFKGWSLVKNSGRFVSRRPALATAIIEMGVERGAWCKWVGLGF